jgi:hypothetical protein
MRHHTRATRTRAINCPRILSPHKDSLRINPEHGVIYVRPVSALSVGDRMRWGAFILLGALTALGCASKPAQPVVIVNTLATPEPAHIYDDAVAAALVYDPPVVANSPRIEISREGRAPEAFAGYEELTATYYYLRVDDRQLNYGGSSGSGGHNNDRFERQAITERVGVSYR